MPTAPDLTSLVIEALRARADQRARASAALAAKLAEHRAGGADVRSGAVKVVEELAIASQLADVADDLEHGRRHLTTPGLQAPPTPADPTSPTPTETLDSEATADEGGDTGTVLVDGLLVDLLPDHDRDDDVDDGPVVDVLATLEAQEATP